MESNVRFPAALLDWAGLRAGGLRRLFYAASGRPSGFVIRTALLDRLQSWAKSIAAKEVATPKVVLLVGGPGNGKTEAIEFTIHALDAALGLAGALAAEVNSVFSSADGRPAPRLAGIDLSKVTKQKFVGHLSIVQDATAADVSRSGSPAELLVKELEALIGDPANHFYVACVNRGVLDDALILATDGHKAGVRSLLEAIVRSVGLSHQPPMCWPLASHPSFAVWPMDVETLIEESEINESPASQLLRVATAPADWPEPKSCPAGERCPFCTSMAQLSGEPHRQSLLRTLRWYELASGKRWSFRDLFTLVSYLLAGIPPNDGGTSYDPCEWAARLLKMATIANSKPDSLRLSAPFLLVGAQYQHALFGHWPKAGIRSFRTDLQELNLLSDPVLMGMYHFLMGARKSSVPSTLESQLLGLASLLDPANADPDMEVSVSAKTTIRFRDIDTRFSQSVSEGRSYIQKFQCLTSLELDLLKQLEAADKQLSDEDIARRKPAIAKRVKALIRDFACRLVRRSIGMRAGAIRDASVLSDYQKINQGDPLLLHETVKQVEALLNDRERFVVTLNTTFGEPLPPTQRRASLITQKQKVKPLEPPEGDRPPAPVRFLSVGSGEYRQAIPLTYDLFKSVRDLRKGMIPASLPRPVVALLDTTRARLSGQIVRDEELLDGSEIRIGNKTDVIVRELGKFLVRQVEAE